MVSLAEVCSCVRRLHPDLRQRISQDTLMKYQKAFNEFIAFLQNQVDLSLTTPEDLDALLMDYRTEMDLSKSQHVLLVASAEFFMPHVKGKLLVCREALKGRVSAEPIRHTVPLTAECALLFAAWHCSEGRMRLGAAIIVQHSTGLRPSEMLALETRHVHVPLERNSAITVRLGANYSTKVKREQYVLVNPSSHPLAWSLLSHLCQTTKPDARLFPFGYNTYNNSFKQAEEHYQLSLGTTAHSGRAGFATHLVLQGVDRKEVQARGRWLSESSFNTYIDITGASHIAALVGSQNLQQTAQWLSTHIWRYFDLKPPSHVKAASVIGRETRLSSQDVSRHDPRATRPLHSLPTSTVPARGVGQASTGSTWSGDEQWVSQRPKGKGRGVPRQRTDPNRSIFH